MLDNFDPAKDYILEDDRVLLRPLTIDDAANLLPIAEGEEDLWEFSLLTAKGEENLKYYIESALKARKTGTEYPFIIFDKATNAYAGCTRFYDINVNFETLQLGYTWYGKIFQRTGLNRHCKFLLLSFAFEQLEMERVEFRADADNKRSIAAMLGIGCTIEGILRSNMPKRQGGRRNSIVLSILKYEWLADKKEQLRAKIF